MKSQTDLHNHHHTNGLLEDYALGTLYAEEAAWMEKHLASCTACRHALVPSMAAVQSLSFAAPEPDVRMSDAQWDRIERLISSSPRAGLAPAKVDDRITNHGWRLYQMRFDPVSFGGRNRADFLTALRAEGIPCAAGYVPLPHQKAIRNAWRSRFGEEAVAGLRDVPRAADVGEHTVWFDQTMSLGADEDMDELVAAGRKIQRPWS